MYINNNQDYFTLSFYQTIDLVKKRYDYKQLWSLGRVFKHSIPYNFFLLKGQLISIRYAK